MPTERTRVRRIPQRARYDPATVHAILDEGLVCHVAFLDGGRSVVVPTGYVRDGGRLLLHGARSSRLMQALASQEACIAVTLLDGLVLARSAFHHSMNYRSVVLFGRGRAIEEPGAKWEAMRAYMERMVPGRWDAARQPSAKEDAATLVVEFPLDEAVAKVRAGPPADEPEDLPHPAWAGLMPLRLEVGSPVQDPAQAPAPPPPRIASWRPERRG